MLMTMMMMMLQMMLAYADADAAADAAAAVATIPWIIRFGASGHSAAIRRTRRPTQKTPWLALTSCRALLATGSSATRATMLWPAIPRALRSPFLHASQVPLAQVALAQVTLYSPVLRPVRPPLELDAPFTRHTFCSTLGFFIRVRPSVAVRDEPATVRALGSSLPGGLSLLIIRLIKASSAVVPGGGCVASSIAWSYSYLRG